MLEDPIPEASAPEARVSLLIPTHALPPLSYRIPEHLKERVRVGTVVVVPLSGYSRLGVVVSFGADDLASEDLRRVSGSHFLPPETVELCLWASEAASVPLSNVIRAALPPGMGAGQYRVTDPLPDWPWEAGKLVSRSALRRVLRGDGLKRAEREGRVELTAGKLERRLVEWAFLRSAAVPDLDRAPRQKELFAALRRRPEGLPARELLSEAGASRATLRALVSRGAVALKRLPEPPLPPNTEGVPDSELLQPYDRPAGRIVDIGGAWIWRMPTRDQGPAVAAVARAAIEGKEQTLVLVPEIESAKDLVRKLRELLPKGNRVVAYHSGLGRDRAAVYDAARSGLADVLVGTRSAAVIPMPRLGAICVVDEPNEGHRAEPGYEGLPIHVREIVRERGWIEGAGTLFLSPHPSLRLYAEKPGVRELPPRTAPGWPSTSILDLRGSGVSLSPTMIEAFRQAVATGKRVGLVANRLGYATSCTCNSCGAVQSCPNCDLPLTVHKPRLVCSRCGFSRKLSDGCVACGSSRLTPTGLTAERVREEVSRALDLPVGLATSAEQSHADAGIVVGTARHVVRRRWDVVAIADVDALLQGSGLGTVERAFRLISGAVEAARERLLIQTRFPEHYALQAALREDYVAFAKAELPRLRALGYPPYGHLAVITLEGKEDVARGAVESGLRPNLAPGVAVSDLVPVASADRASRWRVLLRAVDREAVTQAGAHAARLAHGNRKLKIRIEIDPEEV
ncbi:MAG: hypothetical protein WA990_02085 [Rubrobacteraceae bacterium]